MTPSAGEESYGFIRRGGSESGSVQGDFDRAGCHPCWIRPTKGLDPFAKEELGAAFQEWTAQGKCLVLVTHDIEFSARYAHRCAFLFDGGIVSQEAPDLFFTTNQFYTTAACKMSRGILDGAVTGEEVIRCASGADR